jgi:hypothetical protein
MSKQQNTAIARLRGLWLADRRRKYSTFPHPERIIPAFTDKTANGLTRCIVDFLRLCGHQAERINTTGTPVDNRYTYEDVVGRQRTVGSLTWRKSTTTKGSADISATIGGRSVKVEVKVGSDRQSPAQIEYQRSVEAAGGVYIIARTLAGFMELYDDFIDLIKNEK